MTEEQAAQMRAVLEIEGFTDEEIATAFRNCARDPIEDEKWVYWISRWKLVTETRQ
jgi:hypothetical protein